MGQSIWQVLLYVNQNDNPSNAVRVSGNLMYIRLFSLENIVINSEEIARDLLEHRSRNYSDRPEIATNELYDFLSFGAFLSFMVSTNSQAWR
jgi:hypothetical protein